MPRNRIDYCIEAVRPDARAVIDIGCGLGEVLSALTSVPERVGHRQRGVVTLRPHQTFERGGRCFDQRHQPVSGAGVADQPERLRRLRHQRPIRLRRRGGVPLQQRHVLRDRLGTVQPAEDKRRVLATARIGILDHLNGAADGRLAHGLVGGLQDRRRAA